MIILRYERGVRGSIPLGRTSKTTMIKTDEEAWIKYPSHRDWFNKLWTSERFGHACGPAGIEVPKSGTYIVRPIYNLYGMGANATFQFLTKEDKDSLTPGHFWCEVFEGDHLSIELNWNKTRWIPHSIFQGHHANDNEIFRFSKWNKVHRDVIIPTLLDVLCDCGSINVEMIGDKVIEVHLRGSPDPIEYNEFIPVWSDTSEIVLNRYRDTHKFIESRDHVFGMNVSRLGFFVL